MRDLSGLHHRVPAEDCGIRVFLGREYLFEKVISYLRVCCCALLPSTACFCSQAKRNDRLPSNVQSDPADQPRFSELSVNDDQAGTSQEGHPARVVSVGCDLCDFRNSRYATLAQRSFLFRLVFHIFHCLVPRPLLGPNNADSFAKRTQSRVTTTEHHLPCPFHLHSLCFHFQIPYRRLHHS